MDAVTLKTAINEVCPAVSVTVDSPDDRTTWHYVAAGEATAEQIFSADEVIATIPVYPTIAVTTSDLIARWTNAEYLALERKRAADIAANKIGNAKNWDIVMAGNSINFASKKVQTLKADLVADGILTQARADEIFR